MTSNVAILGVRIANYSIAEALACLEAQIVRGSPPAAVYIVNAHTLNLASEDRGYRELLNRGGRVFADGTGARWAARLRGVRMKANLVGTDLVPALFRHTAGRGYRYFLLGSHAASVARAAQTCMRDFPGWTLAGYHHGYLDRELTDAVIARINASGAHLLLVAMGNPLQERWIDAHLPRLSVPLAIGVGGLFDHWAGNLTRAPAWVRRAGFEWAQILAQQPHKWRRYLLGNPRFLLRILRALPGDLRHAA